MHRRPKEISKTKRKKRLWEHFDWHHDGKGGFLTRDAYRKKGSPGASGTHSSWRRWVLAEEKRERRHNRQQARLAARRAKLTPM